MKSQAKGTFIVLEGIDGAGTTTQSSLLGEALRRQHYHVCQTREPSDGVIGSWTRLQLQNNQLTEESFALLFAADRNDHLAKTILPNLEQGNVVVSDRYVLSSFVYQSIHLPLAWVKKINEFAVPASLTIFLKIDPEVAAQRRSKRGVSAEFFEKPERLLKTAERYDELLQDPFLGPVMTVDAHQGIFETAENILSLVKNFLESR